MWAHHGYPWFGFLFFILVIGFIIFRVVTFRKYGGRRCGSFDEAEAILRKRLAGGEINEEEYQKLKEALKK
ncbi:SHOCT domain-containing protein [Neobacillus ginsengisoli]|uniref:Membrane protein n=1 Tax=Neobacillus ginsengisoli TaxID=904295 RepID=A0ABT9XZJ8_9BACI|nr:hypothetical protein [Neobacillus ginsengisoli]MDQ0200352.1 putative membrane protein [Neobacillus ginsengisoli]